MTIPPRVTGENRPCRSLTGTGPFSRITYGMAISRQVCVAKVVPKWSGCPLFRYIKFHGYTWPLTSVRAHTTRNRS